MTTEILVLIGFIVIVAVIQMIFFLSRYKRPTPSKALVVHGKLDPHNSIPFKIYTRKPTFVLPVMQSFYFLDLTTYDFGSQFENFHFEDASKIKVSCLAKPDEENLSKLVGGYFEKSKPQIEDTISQLIRIKIQSLISENISNSKEDLTIKIKKEILQTLNQNGFVDSEIFVFFEN